MDTTTLTAAEVIDGVRAAQRKEHEGAVEQLQFAVRWALIHPCRDEFPAGWEDDHGIFATTPTAPLAGAGAPLPSSSSTGSLACGSWSRPEWCRCGEPGRSPGRPTTCHQKQWRSPTGSSPPPPRRS